MSFSEKQYFRQPWLWGILIGVVAVSGATVFGVAPAAALIAAMHLEVSTPEDGLHIRFFPFVHRVIPYADIRSAVARTYNPLREYGGWGIRGVGKNRAYNVSGNQGVQLELTNGDRLLLGSQRPEELASAIQAHLGTRGGASGNH